MNCNYGEKIVLYHYGEAGEGLAAEVEAHLRACTECRLELEALRAADGLLAAEPAMPPARAVSAVMRAARAAASSRGGFSFKWGELLFSGAMASLLAFIFAFSGQHASADLAWNSGLDSRLDSVEYALYQTQAELQSSTGDWEFRLSELEDEGYDLRGNV